MINLYEYTVRDLAEMINEDENTILELMANNSHLGYTNKPYENTMKAVEKSKIKNENKDIVTKFLYTNLFNSSEHQFYDTRGYGVTLRGC